MSENINSNTVSPDDYILISYTGDQINNILSYIQNNLYMFEVTTNRQESISPNNPNNNRYYPTVKAVVDYVQDELEGKQDVIRGFSQDEQGDISITNKVLFTGEGNVPQCSNDPSDNSDLTNKRYVDNHHDSYNNLTDKPTIPTQTSQLTNDSGFITDAALANKENTSNKVTSLSAQSTDTQYPSAKCVYDGLANKVDKEAGKGLFSGSYNDLTNKPTIPTVDQIYDGTSANAQSGVAVAKAVAQARELSADVITVNTDTAKIISINDGSDKCLKALTLYGETGEDGGINNPNVKVYGKNLIPYPYINTTKTINGITFTDNGDGSITVNGTATADMYFVLTSLNLYPSGTYFLSGGASGGNSSSYYLDVRNRNNITYTIFQKDYGNGAIIQLSEDDTLMCEIRVFRGKTVNNLVFKPQLELGAAATEYEEYRKTFDVTFNDTVLCTGDGIKMLDNAVSSVISGVETDITNTEAGEAILKLRTNYPNTTIISNTNLSAIYRADTKAYISNIVKGLKDEISV